MDAEASGSRTSELSSHGDENVVQDTPPRKGTYIDKVLKRFNMHDSKK
jgi:hypothetical protein